MSNYDDRNNDELEDFDDEIGDESLLKRVENPEPAEAEQIGSLIFVPNAEYPYPFKTDTPPHFWMTETTGMLSDAVDAYMNGERLSAERLDVIKIYLRQFIERAVMSGGANRKLLLSRIDKLKTTGDVERFADDVSEYGVEVF